MRTRATLLRTLILLSLYTSVLSAATIEVDHFVDSLATPSNCGTNSGLCNLRSAWEYCNAQSGASCQINLPAHTEHTINVEFGHLELQADAAVEVEGNGATVTLASSRRLRAISDHDLVPEQAGLASKISHQSQVYSASDFPFTMSDFTGSNSAMDIYETACVTACSLDLLTFDACGGDTQIDTYFRLFKGGSQVAVNDDSCGHASSLTFLVPPSGQCEEYCLHMGCYENDPCGTTVRFSHVKFVDAMQLSSSSRLFYAKNTNSAHIASLAVRTLNVQSFGDSYVTGGAVYAEGSVQLSIEDCVFSTSTGYIGGALYINNVTSDVEIINTVFENAQARQGGAIHVGSSVDHLRISNCNFTACTSDTFGGAVYLGFDNHDAAIVDSTFTNCTAVSNGGGMLIDQGNDRAYIAQCVFRDCTTMGAGGGVALIRDNHHVELFENTFYGCFAQQFGGGFFVDSRNADLAVRDTTIAHCTSWAFAAGIAILNDNVRARIRNVSITDCEAFWKGSGIFLSFRNINVTLSNVNITRCSGSKGAGMLIDTGNTGLQMSQVRIRDCTASAHAGGVYFGRTNHQATLRDVSITGCRAMSVDGDGGCLYIDTQNKDVVLERVQLSGCSARNGGGLYAEGNHNLLMRDVVVSRCSALNSGGGINLHGASTATTIINAKILHNSAMASGGGIFSGRLSEELTIVNSMISNNGAVNGGGLYVEIGNPQFSVMDARTFENLIVLESAHPYAYIRTQHDVQVDGAVGYYVYFSTQTRVATQDRVSVWGDNAWYSDSNNGKWPGIDIPAVFIPEDHFSLAFECYVDNYNPPVTAEQGYYGFRLIVVPIFPTAQSPTIISHNSAVEAGGGLYFFSGVNYPVMMHARVVSNIASDGGGVYLRNAVIGMLMYGSFFHGNSALVGQGGAVTVSSACQALQFVRCNFTSNRAKGSGGALAYITNNGNPGGLEYNFENYVSECQFDGNNGTTSGGAMFLDMNNTLIVEESTFVNGFTSGDGGALAALQGNGLQVRGGAIQLNTALGCGGGIAEGYFGDILLEQVEVAHNHAAQFGGGICMRTDSTLSYNGTSVSSNTAEVAGGGVACFGSKLPNSTFSKHANNVAARGSAFYFNQLNQQQHVVIAGISLLSNTAAAGTIYWVAGSMDEPDGLYEPEVVYNDNTVEYGGMVATQAVNMHYPSRITVEEYGAFLVQPIEVRLTDYYGEYVKANRPAKVYVSIQNPSIGQCHGRFPFLSGADVSSDGVDFVDGVATLASIDVSCSPGGQVTLLITAALEDLALDMPETRRTLVGTIELHFRSCVVGETIINGKCVPCLAGSYSLEANVTDDTVCTECLSVGSVDSCYVDQIFLADGYWRRHTTSEAIIACLDELSGCGGGNSTGDASCLAGYEGPLCSLCSAGYYRSDRKCILCVDKGHMSPAAVFFSALGAVGLVTVVIFLLYKVQSKDGISAMFLIIIADVAAWFKREARDMKVQLKILTTTFQITSTIPTATNVVFPVQFARYLNAMTVFNLNVMSAVPVDCAHDGTYDFLDKLVMITLAPIGLSLLLLMACIAEYTYRSLAYRHLHAIAKASEEVLDKEEKKLSKVVTRYLTLFFLLTYLVLPFIATTLFRTFLCTDLDPNNEDADLDDLFLTADMRISCTSDYYKRGLAYAAVMIVVYVIGIPLMYLILLYRSRKEIMERFEPLKQESVPIESSSSAKNVTGSAAADEAAAEDERDEGAAPTAETSTGAPANQLLLRHDHAARNALMISFLYEAYEPKYWYWEVVETTRRLMLTAVLSVCGPGTSGQVLFAVLLALIYIKMYGYYAPYTKVSDDVLAETGQFQIFLSFLGALVYQRHLLGNEWNVVIGGILILINTMVLALFVYFACTTLYSEAKTATLSQLSVRHGAVDAAKPIAAGIGSGSRMDPRKVYVAEDVGEAEIVVQRDDVGYTKSGIFAEDEKDSELLKENGDHETAAHAGKSETSGVPDEVVEFVNLRGEKEVS